MIDDLIYLFALLGGGCLLLGVTGWLSDRYYLWCLRQEDKPRLRRPLRVHKIRRARYEPPTPKRKVVSPYGKEVTDK